MKRTHFALGGLLGLLSLTANAQDLQNFKPAPGTWNLLSVETAETAPAGRFVPTAWVNYGLNPLVRRDADGEVTETIIEHFTTLNLMGTYGFTDWLALGVDLPVNYVTGDGIALLGGSGGAGIGDVRVIPKLQLPGRIGGVLGLALSVPVSLPTGDDGAGMGAGTTSINPRAIADVSLGGVTVTTNVGFRARLDEKVVETLALGNEITYGAGLAAELGGPEWLALFELFGAAPANSLDTKNAAPLEALLAGRWFAPFGAVFTAGAGLGLITDYGSPDVRVVLGLGFSELEEPVGDRDGDGLLDPDDQCPDDPEDKDGFEDANGCPDPDNDQDGVLDVQDKCPMDPEDRDQFEDQNGCPDPDNDKDLILDVEDKCPLEPEDKDGFEDADGCPDPDNDQDGILDVDDACPLEPETKNDYKDEDGCPDRKVEVQVTEGKLLVLEPVYFDFDQATIKTSSLPVLDAVAETLIKHPKIKLRVEGHTDAKGSKTYNDRLSQSRVEAVVDYLAKSGGIAADRLTPKGYGMRRPLVDPKTAGAAAKNRRVEFVIVEQ